MEKSSTRQFPHYKKKSRLINYESECCEYQRRQHISVNVCQMQAHSVVASTRHYINLLLLFQLVNYPVHLIHFVSHLASDIENRSDDIPV